MDVIQEVLFIDNETLDYFNSYKDGFLLLNKNKDVNYFFSNFIKIEGINDINLIKLDKNGLPFIGCFWYIIFTILTLSSLYKLYIWIISFRKL